MSNLSKNPLHPGAFASPFHQLSYNPTFRKDSPQRPRRTSVPRRLTLLLSSYTHTNTHTRTHTLTGSSCFSGYRLARGARAAHTLSFSVGLCSPLFLRCAILDCTHNRKKSLVLSIIYITNKNTVLIGT